MQQYVDPAAYKPQTVPVKTPFWKNWKYILGLFIVFALIITSIIRVITPNEPDVPASNFAQTSINTVDKPIIQGITFSGMFTPENKDYTVYSAQQINTTDTLIPALTEKYNLQPLANVPGVWNGPEYSLTFDPEQNNYSFFKNARIEVVERIQPTRALDIATAFLAEVGITTATPFMANAQYFEDPVEMTPTNEFKAEIIVVPFAPSIEGVPLIFNKATFFPYQVMINSSYEVQKLTFQPYTYSASPLRQRPLITIDQALANIQAGKGAIIGVGLVDYTSPTLNEIVSGDLQTATLEYRLDPDLQLLYPFYRFTGTLTNRQNQSFSADLFTPAIATE